jgi:hypothetical protein
VNAAAPLDLHRLPVAELRAELRSRLAGEPATGEAPRIGHYAGVDPRRLESLIPAATTRAAVPFRSSTAVTTSRSSDAARRQLEHHAGQISFRAAVSRPGMLTRSRPRCAGEEEIGLRRGIVMYTLHHAAEIRSIDTVDELQSGATTVKPEEMKLAQQVIATFDAPLDLADYKDEYREGLQRIIDAKIAGEEIETFDLPWGSFHIWGATAGMLLTLREVLGEAHSSGH